MILTLKNDALYFPENYIIPEGPVRLEFDLPEGIQGEMKVSINNSHKKVFKEPFYIREDQMKAEELQVFLYIGGNEYKSERINVSKMIALGDDYVFEKNASIIDLEKKVSILKRDIDNIKEAIIEMAKKGEII